MDKSLVAKWGELIKKGKECFDSGDYQCGLHHFQEAAKISPSPKSDFYLARAYSKNLNLKESLETYKKAILALSQNSDLKLLSKCYRGMINVYKRMNQMDEALDILLSIIKNYNGEEFAWVDDEIKDLTKEITERNKNSTDFYQKGCELEKLGRFADAIEKYTLSLESLKNAETYLKRAQCYFRLNNFAEALIDFKAYFENYHGDIANINPEIYLNRGICEFYKGEYSDSLSNIRKSVDHADFIGDSLLKQNCEQYLSIAAERVKQLKELHERRMRIPEKSQADFLEEVKTVKATLEKIDEYKTEGSIWHALSMIWFNQWKYYAHHPEETIRKIPPIDNYSIISLEPFNLQTEDENKYKNIQIRPSAYLQKDFIWIPHSLWLLLDKTYCGIDIKRYMHLNQDIESSFIKGKIIFRPKRSWFPKLQSQIMYFSKHDQLSEIRDRCEKLNIQWMKTQKVSLDPKFLKSNIWIFTAPLDCDIEKIDEKIKNAKTNAKSEKVKIDAINLNENDKNNLAEIIQNTQEIIIFIELIEKMNEFTFYGMPKILQENTCISNLLEFTKVSLNSLMPKGANMGKTGLINMGNTCYFNSALQCLSQCEDLTKYFLQDLYKPEINYENPLGLKGKLATAYASFIKEMWIEKNRVVSPFELKKVISLKADQFKGLEQHDSQELMLHLLDGIHEDLNRIKTKPYVENANAEGRADLEVSKEQWEKYLMRNKSVIVDLFAGQFKSRVVCPLCKLVSVTFDPYTILSVPIPQMTEIKVNFIPLDILKTPIKIIFNASETSTLLDLDKRISAELKLEVTSRLFFALVENSKIYMKPNSGMTLADVKYNSGELYAYEYQNIEGKNSITNFIETRISFSNGTDSKKMAYPFVFPVSDTNTTIIDIKKQIYKKLSPILTAKDTYSESKSYLLEIMNNRPLNPSSVFAKKYVDCEFCDKKAHEGNCSLTAAYDNLSIQSMSLKIKHKRDFVLSITFNQMADLKQKLESFKNIESNTKSFITLMDCFESFVRDEQLDKDNMWFCKRCQKDVQAKKQMELFKLPRILVVHLKRFKNKIVSVYLTRQKNDDFVEYPVEDLDLTRFLKYNETGKGYHYKLFAVSNHYGGLQGGHYTATCYNPVTKEWLECDDSSVTETKSMVTKAGYVLFYKLIQD